MIEKLFSFFKSNLPNYKITGATEKTHIECPECNGSGRDDVFHDCENCGGTGIVKKSFEESR